MEAKSCATLAWPMEGRGLAGQGLAHGIDQWEALLLLALVINPSQRYHSSWPWRSSTPHFFWLWPGSTCHKATIVNRLDPSPLLGRPLTSLAQPVTGRSMLTLRLKPSHEYPYRYVDSQIHGFQIRGLSLAGQQKKH